MAQSAMQWEFIMSISVIKYNLLIVLFFTGNSSKIDALSCDFLHKTLLLKTKKRLCLFIRNNLLLVYIQVNMYTR